MSIKVSILQILFMEVIFVEKKKSDKKKHKKIRISPKVRSIIEDWETASDDSMSDVLGSYTGNPADGEMPQQDADDL